MQLGLCEYKRGDGGLAQQINAKWARFEADLTGDVPDLSADIDDALANGCAPIVDCRTSMTALATVLYGDGDPEHNKVRAVDGYADKIVAFAERHPEVKCIEVWGSAEVAYVTQGRGMSLDYSMILQQVHDRIKAELPGRDVWTGGFGINCLPDFIELALSKYAPAAFDICNWHPFILTSGYPEADVQTCGIRLRNARRMVDENCDGQPFAASGFGIPTVRGRPPAEYGRFWRLGGRRGGDIRGVPEEEAAAWYLPLLDMFAEFNFRCICLLVRDRKPRWMHDWCGLLRRDGTPKAFLNDVAEWGHSHGAT